MVQEHKTWYDRMGFSELNRKNSEILKKLNEGGVKK